MNSYNKFCFHLCFFQVSVKREKCCKKCFAIIPFNFQLGNKNSFELLFKSIKCQHQRHTVFIIILKLEKNFFSLSLRYLSTKFLLLQILHQNTKSWLCNSLLLTLLFCFDQVVTQTGKVILVFHCNQGGKK